MSRGWKRLALMAFVAAIMIVVLAAQKPDPPKVHFLRVTLGLKDEKPMDWSGKLEVKGGEIVALEGWRFEDKDQVMGKEEWKCSTHEYVAPGERFKLETPGKPNPAPPNKPWPNGVTITIQGDQPNLALNLAQGKIELKLADLKLGEPNTFIDGQVQIERLPEVKILRPPAAPNAMNAVQDDYPAFWVRYKTGKHYLAWVAYQKEKDRVLLAERDGPDGQWSEPIEVAGPGDHFRVALASTHQDDLWIVWSSQRNGNWDLFARNYKDGKLGDEVRLTDAAGPDIWHRMTTDNKGRAWLVWQGFRDGQADIFARCADGDKWQAPIKVSDSPANDWDPAITADTKEDRVWIGWDTYDKGSYSIRLRTISGGANGELGKTEWAGEPQMFNTHVTLACDKDGKLWAAWDRSGPEWGKDTGDLWQQQILEPSGTRLYDRRTIDMRVRESGDADIWWRVSQPLKDSLPPEMQEYHELPQLQADSDGRIWLAFRVRTCRRPREDGWAAQGRWDAYAVAARDGGWTKPIPLLHSGGRNDMRISSQRDRDGNVYFAYGSDNRGWLPPGMTERNLSIAVSKLSGSHFAAGGPAFNIPAGLDTKEPVVVHPKEKEQVARIRAYKIEQGGRTYRIYRGDLHRHTDISGDGVGDGSLMDLHRYGLDAAAFDFIMVGDHNMGGDREYPWWRTQQANDLYTVPGSFISMYGYERSVRYPNGHRNVIWTERGHRTLPLPQQAIPAQLAADTGKLYGYLRETGGICTAHTSATDQGTDWKEFDPALEPIVEIFQGFHVSYEAPGAPLAIDEKSRIVHTGYKPDGYVSLALDKGYRVGFQSSSDHVSTHVSYSCVLAEEFSRKGLVEAMKKRHTYGATDNIILDVRAGRLGIMGDEISTNQPQLDVVVIGTAPLDRAEVIRNGKLVHTAKPDKESDELRFTWQDPNPEKGKTSYYYVRVIQKNKQMAWASPVWVKGD